MVFRKRSRPCSRVRTFSWELIAVRETRSVSQRGRSGNKTCEITKKSLGSESARKICYRTVSTVKTSIGGGLRLLLITVVVDSTFWKSDTVSYPRDVC